MAVYYHCKNRAEKLALVKYRKGFNHSDKLPSEYFKWDGESVYPVEDVPFTEPVVEMEKFINILNAELGQLFVLNDGEAYLCYAMSKERGNCWVVNMNGGVVKLFELSAHNIAAVYSVSECGYAPYDLDGRELLYMAELNKKVGNLQVSLQKDGLYIEGKKVEDVTLFLEELEVMVKNARIPL